MELSESEFFFESPCGDLGRDDICVEIQMAGRLRTNGSGQRNDPETVEVERDGKNRSRSDPYPHKYSAKV